MEECSLEMTEVSRGGGRRWWRQESNVFGKDRESLSRLSFSDFKSAHPCCALGTLNKLSIQSL